MTNAKFTRFRKASREKAKTVSSPSLSLSLSVSPYPPPSPPPTPPPPHRLPLKLAKSELTGLNPEQLKFAAQ